MMLNLPFVRPERVYHIGTLNPADLGVNSGNSSLEGNCLSVSVTPHGWRQIAKLGGYPLHEMTCGNACFLDVHKALDDDATRKFLVDWAVQKELLREVPCVEVFSYDDELDSWICHTVDSFDDALDELGISEEELADHEDEAGRALIVESTMMQATPALHQLVGGSARNGDATDYALIAWVMTEAEEKLGFAVDGLWWRENYDPDCYSAPRGSIIPSRVPAWQAKEIGFNRVDDEEELDGFPGSEWSQEQVFCAHP